ncbi:MAG TPA: Gfo/Idh/MocA family oxidoreductase [Polyangiaceae bacterium]|nr:Gfo/Idh/MocA family oxidoreductase [Polyangiaceae bacterium]
MANSILDISQPRSSSPTASNMRRRELLLGVVTGGFAMTSLGCSRNASSGSNSNAAGPSQGPQGNTPPGTGKTNPRQLGVALLGLGNYSETQLAPSLKLTRHCSLRGIVTGSPDKIPRWQKEYGIPDRNVYDYGSLPRIADNSAIDIVYIVVPTALHAKYAVQAAEAGKHVWCEKPMAMTVEECQKIIDACRANHVSLAIGYRMHHEPNTQTVMQFAREKPYGAIKAVRAIAGDRSNGENTWRMVRAMGGGALYDMGVYSINAIRYASGEEPVRVVRARQWADRPELFRDVDENTEFELELPSGAIAYGKASRFDKTNQLRVEAQRGWYQLEPMQAYEGVQGETSDGKKLDKKVDKQQARQMDDEALALLEGRPAMVPGEEGQRDIRLVQAILQAASTDKPVAL